MYIDTTVISLCAANNDEIIVDDQPPPTHVMTQDTVDVMTGTRGTFDYSNGIYVLGPPVTANTVYIVVTVDVTLRCCDR